MEEKKIAPASERVSEVRDPAQAGDRSAVAVASRSAFPDWVDFLVMVGIYFVAQGIGAVLGWLVAGWPDWKLLTSAGPDAVDPVARAAEELVAGRFNALSFFVTMSLTLVGLLLYRKWRGGVRTVARFSKRGFNPLLLLYGLALMVTSTVVIEPVLNLLPAVPSVYGRGVWALVTLVVMAPLFEETIFRGVILESARARYGTVAAWFVSAFVFGLAHLHPALAVNAFVLGLVLGYIYIRTESLWSTVILHAVNNALAYLMLLAGWQDLMLIRAIGNRSLYIAVYCVALVAFAASGYMVYRTLKRIGEEEKSTPAA